MSDSKENLAARINAYEAKQERKRERKLRAADRAEARAASAERTATRIYDIIPFGQPILVGHHSERRHRRDIAKARAATTRRFMEYDKAKRLRRSADAIGTGGISSDDPSAVAKLEAELAAVTARLALEKDANAQLRKLDKAASKAKGGVATNQADWLAAIDKLNVPEDIKVALRMRARLFSWLPQFHVVNTNANRKRIEDRIKALKLRDAAPAREPIVGDGWRIEENRDENRVQIRFDGKPDEAMRTKLKSYGFRWSPFNSAWQRQLNYAAWRAAQYVMGVSS